MTQKVAIFIDNLSKNRIGKAGKNSKQFLNLMENKARI